MSSKITRFFPAILVLFHAIGLVLFIQSDTASELTWLNLTLCGLLVFLTEPKRIPAFFVFLLIFIGGFMIELVGTKTGYLFGNYAYGDVLGTKLMGVSLIIGVNWYGIVLASANLARQLKQLPLLVKSLVAGVLCTVMDFVIEPVAIKYGFWTWQNDEIPVYNYVTWFVFSTFFSFVYLRLSEKTNRTAVWLFFVWLAFFITLTVL